MTEAAQDQAPLVMISANQAWNLVNFRSALIGSLLAEGFRVMAVAPIDPKWTPRLRAMGCAIEAMPLDASGLSPLNDIRTVFALRRLMRLHRPALWLSWTIKPNLYGALAARANRVVAIPNVSGLGTAFIGRSVLTNIVTRLYRLAFRRCPTVFFQNEDDRALFRAAGMVRGDQARLLPGSGVDLDRFSPPTGDRSVRAVFTMISRLLADKGVREFVAAARMVRRDHPQARFRLVGPLGVDNRSAIKPAELQSWVAEGVIDYRPPLDDVRPAIAEADWIVLPSYREGMSRVLIEAAAMGRPIVTTDVPGCRHIVSDGENGFLAAPRDAVALAAAMRRALAVDTRDWPRMALASRARAVSEFGHDKVVALYRRAIADAGIDMPEAMLTPSQRPHLSVDRKPGAPASSGRVAETGGG